MGVDLWFGRLRGYEKGNGQNSDEGLLPDTTTTSATPRTTTTPIPIPTTPPAVVDGFDAFMVADYSEADKYLVGSVQNVTLNDCIAYEKPGHTHLQYGKNNMHFKTTYILII